jgi:hypothetical protein
VSLVAIELAHVADFPIGVIHENEGFRVERDNRRRRSGSDRNIMRQDRHLVE